MLGFQDCQALVVDDDLTVTEVVADILSEAGYSVLTAESGERALEIYACNAIDIVMTDIRMPGIDGFELIKRLRLVDNNVKVIVMTGHDSYEALLKHENTNLMLQLKESHEQLATANRNLVAVNQKLKRLAVTDGLTLLYNRRFFEQILKREIERRNRYQTDLSIVMIDVDDFKVINNEFGHSAGDNALKEIGKILTQCARTADIVARYGGEEFVVVLPVTTPDKAGIFAERFRKAVDTTKFDYEGEVIDLTVSLGIIGVDKKSPAVNGAALVAIADEALAKAKRQGKNCVVNEGVIEFTGEVDATDATDTAAADTAGADTEGDDRVDRAA